MCSQILLASILLKIFVSMFISKIGGGCIMWSATELRVRLGIVFGWEDQVMKVWRSLTYFPIKYHLLFFIVKLFKIFWQFWNVYFVGCWDKIFSKWNFKKYFFLTVPGFSPFWQGKSWQQEIETAGHTAHTFTKHREKWMILVTFFPSFYSVQEPNPENGNTQN